MFTVIDHANPWLMPRSTFAPITHPHAGAQMMMKGTGRPKHQPAMSTRRRLQRSERRPAKRLVSAFAAPKVAMNETAAVFEGAAAETSEQEEKEG